MPEEEITYTYKNEYYLKQIIALLEQLVAQADNEEKSNKDN